MPAKDSGRRDRTFLSYARADERYVLRFADDLRERGVAIWVDQLNIRTSEHWDRAIESAIHDCRAMVVFVSPRAVVSDNVADEISLAIECRKTIIPVMIETCRLPLRLTRMHLIDGTTAYESAVTQCLTAIRDADAVITETSSTLAHDAAALKSATAHLAEFVGPIAGILVEQAGGRASSLEDLYGMLSLHIDDESERERFLGSRGDRPFLLADGPVAIAPRDVQRVASVLARYLGPIATIVARRESAAAQSLSELLGRVATTIRCENERDDFRREIACVQSSSSS